MLFTMLNPPPRGTQFFWNHVACSACGKAMKQAKSVARWRSSTRLPLKVQSPLRANNTCSGSNVRPPSVLRRNTRLEGAKSPLLPSRCWAAASTVPELVTSRLGRR